MRIRRIVLRVGAAVIGIPFALVLLALVIVLAGVNVGPGQRLIERKLGPLTGGMVELAGLSGALPWHVAFATLRLHDRKGVWLEIDGFDFHWSPLSLLRRDLAVSDLGADRIALYRPPVPAAEQGRPAPENASSGGFPDMQVDITRLHVGRIELGAAFMGQSAVFTADGHVHIASTAPLMHGITVRTLPKMNIGFRLTRTDQRACFDLALRTPSDGIAVNASYQEAAGGFATTLGHQAQLDPIATHLNLVGPRDAASLDFGLKAGPVTAGGQGRVNLLDNSGALRLTANAPAMTLLPGVGWNGVALAADLHGPFRAPVGTGTLDIDALSAPGAGVEHLHAQFNGDESSRPEDTLAHIVATLTGLRVPGPRPDILAIAPLVLDVTAHPLGSTRPVVLSLDHPLLHATLNADLAPAAKGHLDLTLPDLGPLAAMGGVAMTGHAGVGADFAMPATPRDNLTLAADGTLAITGGQAQATHLIGPDGRFSVRASRAPDGVVTLSNFGLDGRALHVLVRSVVDMAHGYAMQATAHVGLPDLHAASPALQGGLTLDAQASGPTNDLALKAHLGGDFGTQQVPRGPIALDADFTHLPSRPQGTLMASGTLDRAPLALDSAVSRDEDGTLHVDLHKLSWNSIQGHGALHLQPGAKVPLGDLDIEMRDLGNLRRLIGQQIGGRFTLALHTTESGDAPPVVKLALDGRLAMPMASVQSLRLGGTIAAPLKDPRVDLALDLAGLRAKSITGHARVVARGPQSALALGFDGSFLNLLGAPAHADLAALLDLPHKRVRMDRLLALVKGEQIRLGRPASVSFGDTMGVDRLLVTLAPSGVAPATIDVAGTLKPALALTAHIDHLTPAIARPFAPELVAKGVVSLDAKLAGTMQAPTGTVALAAHGLRMQTGPAASLPATEILANIGLTGKAARIDATLAAGPSVALAVHGTAPLAATGVLGLNATGHVDLSVANGILGANGMSLAGQIGIDMAVSGTLAQPRASGRVQLRNAAFDQYAQGVHLTDMNGALVASGDTITLDQVVAHAGPGTIGVDGSIGIFRPGLPVALHVVSQRARPVASDLLTATIDTDLHIHGQATTRLDVDGQIRIPNATINIPDSMPASVPQLDIIRPGQKPPGPSTGLIIGLGIEVVSPGELFVRGHGVFAEMQGTLHVGGTSVAPVVTGGFDLRRGNFNLAGINLNFTQGQVAFNGAGVNHKLDPTLNFRADRNARGTLASLLVTGYASAPKIDFTSSPSLPRDQVLSILLFGTDTHSLSATQLAELGAAVATLAGGSSFDPLGKVRNALGLDRLSMGGGSSVGNGGTSVEAGKYVMRGVYVGAKQATSGSGTQAQVQIDLTKRLKLNTTVGTGGQVTGFTTPENDPGSSVGLSYGFDY